MRKIFPAKPSNETAAFECVEPEIGGLMKKFLAKDLGGNELEVFQSHLKVCHRCAEKVAEFKIILAEMARQLETRRVKAK